MDKLGSIDEIVIDEKIDAARLLELLRVGSTDLPAGYLHWRKIGPHTVPAHLSVRECWLAMKLHRQTGRREIGLKDRDGRPFTLGAMEPFAEALHRLDREAKEAKEVREGTEVKAARRTQRVRARERHMVSALMEEAAGTWTVEGVATPLELARELLRTGRTPQDDEERLIQNTYHTLEFVREARGQPLSLALFSEMHQRLLAGTAWSRPAGQLRREDQPLEFQDEEGGFAHAPPPSAELPARLKALLAFANGRAPGFFVHPVVRAILAHFWVLHDQPFATGNGPMARAVFYWAVWHAGYDDFACLSLSRLLRDAPGAYRRAVHDTETDDNDLNYFVAHQLGLIERAQRAQQDEVRQQETETRAAEQQCAGVANLNPRQHALLAQALKHPAHRHTLREHARAHRLSRQTARNDFNALVTLGYFEEAKSGKTLVFFAVPQSEEKIQLPPGALP